MNVNKLALGATLLTLCLGVSSTPARAANIVPSLYGINDIAVNYARFGNKEAANNCKLLAREVSDQVLATLKKDKLPARASMHEKPEGDQVISAELVPELVTLVPRDNLCATWVGFTLQSRNAINLPPTDYHRNVKLVYWKGGLLVSTTPLAHKRGVKEAVNQLAGQLQKQYMADQPPKL